MKIFILIMTTFLCQVSARSFGQTITFKKNNTTIEQAFDEITRQTGLKVICDGSLIVGTEAKNVNFKNASINIVLEKFFDKQLLVYQIIDNTIVIKVKEMIPITPIVVPQKEVHGVVRDSTGVMPGVSVTVKGTKTGTTTGLDGRYGIIMPSGGTTLVFSMIGYLTQEVLVDTQTVVNIMLKPDIAGLDEVVVVGFGKQKRTDMVGSVVSVKPAELKVPSSNLTTALAGRVAGVIAYQRSGEPGADNAEFFIRGVTTFGYKVDPLILIDNVEVTTTDLARLQVDDIASFSIMKDATSTAIYGARGANGVILITTKEGVEGKVKLDVRVENSISAPTRNIELADPITYMRLHNESVLTRDPSLPTYYDREKIENTMAGENPVVYPTTDWRSSIMKDYTVNQRVNLSVTGGGKVAKYFVSGAVNNDNGVLKVDKKNNFNNNISLKNYSLRSNVNMDLTSTTELLVRLNGSFDDYSGPVDGGTKVYRDIMRSNPVLFAPYYEPTADERFVKHILFGNAINDQNQQGYINPYANLVSGYKDYSRSMMLAQVELRQDFSFLTKGLNFRAMANTTRNSYFDVVRKYSPFYYNLQNYDRNSDTYDLNLINEGTGTEYLDYNKGEPTVSSLFYMESALNYSRTFAKKHTIGGLLVYVLRQQLNGNGTDLQQSLPFRNTGISGRFTYSYDSRYYAEFTFGYNGSERFYKTHQFGFFPSVGVAWTVSNEEFWKPFKDVVTNFRLRGTYGLVGNDAIGGPSDRFFYLSNVNMNSTARGAIFGREGLNSKNGISIDRYPNNDITWETAAKTNLGVELSLFGKLQVTADLFSENRKNILMTRASTPATFGLNAPVKANVGEAKGKGIDASVDYTQSFGSDFWIQGRANFTYATSKFTVYEEPQYADKYLSRIGYSLAQEWGYIAERLFIDEEEVQNSPKQNFGPYMAGDIKYRDVNNDGQISTLDQVPIGYPTTPEIVYGFGFSSKYKAVDFSAFFQGAGRESFWVDPGATSPFGRYVYSGESFPATTILQNQLLKAYADDHWSEDNRNLYALWPRLSFQRVANNEQKNTFFMRDGTFLRLKQLEVGYTLPASISKKIKLQNLRVYANGSNLFTMSSFKLWDVEMAGNGLGYPVQRVFNLGVQLSL